MAVYPSRCLKSVSVVILRGQETSRWRKPPDRRRKRSRPGRAMESRTRPASIVPPGRAPLCEGSGGLRHRLISAAPPAHCEAACGRPTHGLLSTSRNSKTTSPTRHGPTSAPPSPPPPQRSPSPITPPRKRTASTAPCARRRLRRREFSGWRSRGARRAWWVFGRETTVPCLPLASAASSH